MAINNIHTIQSVGLLSVGGVVFSGKANGRAKQLSSITRVCNWICLTALKREEIVWAYRYPRNRIVW